jgi:hypothetical protein
MFEEALSLRLGRVGKINPDVHTSRSAQRWIKTLNVIDSEEKKAIGMARTIEQRTCQMEFETHQPSAESIESKLARRPLRLTLEPPFPSAAASVPLANAASKSFNSKMHL